MCLTKLTVSLYLYDEPVLETYWTDMEAARSFAEKAFPRRVVQAVLMWRGEGKPWPETVEAWTDPDLLFYVAKRQTDFFHLQNSDNAKSNNEQRNPDR
jgi:hypothetical protein